MSIFIALFSLGVPTICCHLMRYCAEQWRTKTLGIPVKFLNLLCVQLCFWGNFSVFLFFFSFSFLLFGNGSTVFAHFFNDYENNVKSDIFEEFLFSLSLSSSCLDDALIRLAVTNMITRIRIFGENTENWRSSIWRCGAKAVRPFDMRTVSLQFEHCSIAYYMQSLSRSNPIP